MLLSTHSLLCRCCQMKLQPAELLIAAVILMLPAAIRRNENLVQQVQQVERLQQQNSQLQQTMAALRQQLNKETIWHQQQARAAGQHGRGFAEMQLRHGDAQQQVRAAASMCYVDQCQEHGVSQQDEKMQHCILQPPPACQDCTTECLQP